MSFSSALKREICGNRSYIHANREAVCLGLVLFGRTCDESRVALQTENRWVSRLYSDLLYELVEIKTSITATEQILGEGRKLYDVEIDTQEDRRAVLTFMRPLTARLQQCDPELEESSSFLRGVLCGAFLSCANISDPAKSYHLEFVAHRPSALSELRLLMDKLQIRCRRTERKGVPLLYVKSSEEIEDLLTMLGAGKSALEIMNVKIYKDVRNKVNRVTNCETANIGRTVSASSASCAKIRLIDERMGIDQLPGPLQQLARLRLENPDIPLAELSQMVSPPLSRSGVHYRLRQLSEIAQQLEARGNGLPHRPAKK